jgi:hypothetical protein
MNEADLDEALKKLDRETDRIRAGGGQYVKTRPLMPSADDPDVRFEHLEHAVLAIEEALRALKD